METETHGYNPDILWSQRESFDVISVIPHCAKEQERECLRIELFDKATVALNTIDQTDYTTIRGLIKAEKDAWDYWARQWWDGPCPFYQPPHAAPSDVTLAIQPVFALDH